MNNAHIESKAVPSDLKGVHSIVRRFAACCVIGVAAMSVAHAGPRDREREAQQYQQYQQYQQPQQYQRDANRGERAQRQSEQRQYEQRQYDQRQYDQRPNDQRQYEEQRRSQQMQEQQSQGEGRRSGRLTPDERRDLRRQINEAGADIYPSRNRR